MTTSWDYAAEAAWHAAPCTTCTHERDQHEVDGQDAEGTDLWGCYGGGFDGPCHCLTPRYA